MNAATTPLKFLGAPWFASVMGLCGLALAWNRAVPAMGDMAGAITAVLTGLAALVFVALLGAYLLRRQRYPQAAAEDFKHPVRYPFVATLPLSVLLLATLGTALWGPNDVLRGLWMLGAAWQMGVTLWALGRWLQLGSGSLWPGMTPALFIPVVGNVQVPLAGLTLGFDAWSAAQFGVGLFFWPVVMILLVVRVGVQGLWPERMLASTFITVAPPALVGLAALQWSAPASLVWMAWGIALFFLLWSAGVLKRMLAQPFGMAFWGLSFPLAAFCTLTLRLSLSSPAWFQAASLMLLALTTLVIAALSLATVKGLRQGTLLVPEQVAVINAASA